MPDPTAQTDVTLDEMAAAAHRVMVDRPVRVDAVHCNPATWHQLQGVMWESALSGGHIAPPGLTEPSLLGVRLVVDPHLPPDVWRLTDEDETLLYDCREGKPVS